MAELRAFDPKSGTMTTIAWHLTDGRVAALLRIAYHKTAPEHRGDWVICIYDAKDGSSIPVAPFEWQWADGSPIEDINAAGIKGWQTVTHAPEEAVEAVERSPMLLLTASRMWVKR